jgi:hypothetical protein
MATVEILWSGWVVGSVIIARTRSDVFETANDRIRATDTPPVIHP